MLDKIINVVRFFNRYQDSYLFFKRDLIFLPFFVIAPFLYVHVENYFQMRMQCSTCLSALSPVGLNELTALFLLEIM